MNVLNAIKRLPFCPGPDPRPRHPMATASRCGPSEPDQRVFSGRV